MKHTKGTIKCRSITTNKMQFAATINKNNEAEAKAKLTNAAQDLLTALSEWVEWRDKQKITNPYPEEYLMFQKAKAAIQKATQ